MSMVPVVIPFFKEREKLERCLAAIKEQNNARMRDLRARQHERQHPVHRRGERRVEPSICYRPDIDYVMVLNQDAYLHRDCIRLLMEFMRVHPDCGIACPLQVAQDKRTVTWGGSLQAFPFGVHRCDDFARYVQPAETYWANGACMMIRTRVVEGGRPFDGTCASSAPTRIFPSLRALAAGRSSWCRTRRLSIRWGPRAGNPARRSSGSRRGTRCICAEVAERRSLPATVLRRQRVDARWRQTGSGQPLHRAVTKLDQAARDAPPGPDLFPSWVAATGPSAPGGS